VSKSEFYVSKKRILCVRKEGFVCQKRRFRVSKIEFRVSKIKVFLDVFGQFFGSTCRLMDGIHERLRHIGRA
jgi:hypothetical protein